MPAGYDIFFSYRRHDLDRAKPLIDVLAACGLRIFRDETAIDQGGSITQEIREGLASSKLLLAFYSRTYSLSSACQEEIISAWLTAQLARELPQSRVRIINPEPTFDHIPLPVRDLKAYQLPQDPARLEALTRDLRNHIDSLKNGLLAAAQLALPKYHGMVPVHAPHFVGRVHELWDLHSKLTANHIALISGIYGQGAVQIRGIGGNGKSFLARRYALQFGSTYPGGVFWLNAHGHDDSIEALDEESRLADRREQLRGFAQNLGIAIEGLKPEEIETAFWRQLEGRKLACLWIVDDVPSGITLSSLERYWLAHCTNISTLITTRSREYESLGQQIDLGGLAPDEAITVLTRRQARLKNSSGTASARQIAEALGCHALAVEVAGSYVAKAGITFGHYLDELNDPRQDALEFGALLRESLPTGHERSITRTLLKSIQLLDKEGRDFLRLAACLAVAPVTTSFLREVFEAVGIAKGISDPVLMAVDQADSLSLCERVGDDAWSVHSLVSRVVRFVRVDGDRVEQLRNAAVAVLKQHLSTEDYIRERTELANEVVHGRRIAVAGLTTEAEADLAASIAWHDYMRGDYGGARQLQEQVLLAQVRLLGSEHPYTVKAMHNLAGTLSAQGNQAEARSLEEQVVEAFGRLLGKEDPITLRSTLSLANMLYQGGDLAGARQLQEQLLAASVRLLGKEHPDTLGAMNNLALTLSAQGDLARAHELAEQLLEARVRVSGKEHPDTLAAMTILAGRLYEQGALAEARKLREEVVEIVVRVRDKYHPHALTAMSALAETLSDEGDLTAARQLKEHVVEARARLLGDEHPETLAAMSNLAATMYAQGNVAEAVHLLDQVLGASLRVLGKEHPQTLTVMNNLAHMLSDHGHLDEAVKLQEYVLEVSVRVLGEESPNTLATMMNLAATLSRQGHLDEAGKLQKHVLDVKIRVLGKEHSDTLGVMTELAQTLFTQRDLTGTRQLQERVLEARMRLLGEEHRDTLTVMNNLAVTLYEQGDLAEASKLQKQELKTLVRLLGEEHPDTLTLMNNLARTLSSQGGLGEARKLQEQVVATSVRLLGEEHSLTLTAMNNLAEVLLAQGDLAGARQLQEQVGAVLGRLSDKKPLRP
jgi:tetratricopeptide (TPR) repeat protein